MTGSKGLTGSGAAIALFSLGIFMFAVNDALGKWLVADYAVGQLLLLRTVGALLVLGPMMLNAGRDMRLHGQWPLHALRVLCMAGDTFCFYFATKTLPLADVMTFYLAAPIIVTALSVPILQERVGRFRWAAVLVGFLGVVIALRPTGASVSPAALVALLGSAMFAAAMTITRQLRDTHWLTLVTWQFAGAGLLGGVASAFAWTAPTALDLGLMFLVGVVSMIAFGCMARALALAPASLLAPFQYASIVWAVALGWLVFGDTPTPNILLGSLIIVGSGLVVFTRERWLERTARPA